MKASLVALLLVVSLSAQADYLKLSGDYWIKKEPKSNATKLKKVMAGELLVLLDSGQQNRGYYHVQYPKSSIKGYIYRTLVERISGKFPTFYDTTNAVEITIIDVGPGMSAMIKLPNDEIIIYDAGAYNRTFEYLDAKYPTEKPNIEYLILSHTDSDHWGSVKAIVENYTVKNVLRTNYRFKGGSNYFIEGAKAIVKNVPSDHDLNLSEIPMVPDTLFYEKDGVKLYFIMGFGKIPRLAGWEKLSESKKNNGVSIVVKLVYGQHSILFTGDAVGRKEEVDGCIASEKFMLDSLSHDLLKTNVLVAAHHGAENASCMQFINTVSPEYVIFPAGHHGTYKHPRLSTADRFIKKYKLSVDHIFRTDRGDYESSGDNKYKKHWNQGTTPNDGDRHGDDHIKIVFPLDGIIQIGYELDN